MFSTILLVALSTVSGHKCHGCAVYSDCCAPACSGCAISTCNGCWSNCSCARRHKCGLFKRLFSKRCGCACSYDCGGCNGCHVATCCDPCGCAVAAPACCDPCGCAAPSCAEPAQETHEEKAEDPATTSGFKVNRSPFVQVSYETERAEYADEPVVIFARR